MKVRVAFPSLADGLGVAFTDVICEGGPAATAGSDVGVAAVKSMLSAANSAYDTFTKAAKQATEIAAANAPAATETMKGFAKANKAA